MTVWKSKRRSVETLSNSAYASILSFKKNEIEDRIFTEVFELPLKGERERGRGFNHAL